MIDARHFAVAMLTVVGLSGSVAALAQASSPAVGDGGGESDVARSTMRARPAVIYPNARACQPEYPAAALKAHAQGVTGVRFTVSAEGRLLGARIVQASGSTPEHQLLDEAAVTALSRCPFRAGTDESGKAVGAEINVSYRWKLE